MNIPWFVDLHQYQLECLARTASVRSLAEGEELFREGARDDFMYIILEGQIVCETYVPSQGSVYLFTADPLDILGWSSMTPVVRQRTASARAAAPTRLLAFESDALKRICEEDHDLGYKIMRRLANVVASQLLVTRLVLFDLIIKAPHEHSI